MSAFTALLRSPRHDPAPRPPDRPGTPAVTADARPQADDTGDPHRWRIMAVLGAVAFMAQLDFFIVNVALDGIGHSFPGSSVAGLSWVLSAYATVFAAVLVGTEPGNLSFEVYANTADPANIVLLERYASREDFAAHRETPHFHDLVLAKLVPLLQTRTVELLDATD